MPLVIKIIISILLILIPIGIYVFITARLKKYEAETGYLKTLCTKRILVPLWMCKDEGPSKWSAIYRYTYKNVACTYKTMPKSNKISKPKPKSKIPLFINPMAPQQAYNPNEYFDMDAAKSKRNLTILTGLLFLLNMALVVFIII